MWLFLPAAAIPSGAPVHVAPAWLAIIVGVILVNGLAEEVVHRAFFFGRLRERTNFWAAATVGAALFSAQHFYLIASIGVAGTASVVLAFLLAYPLSRAFERRGRSISVPPFCTPARTPRSWSSAIHPTAVC
jgi:membrane protease YdiL (CAAX protease family)